MVGDARPLRVLVVGAGVAGISVARGLLRDGHDVTVFESRPRLAAAGGAVTVWSNGETVLRQLGVEMDGAGWCRAGCCWSGCWADSRPGASTVTVARSHWPPPATGSASNSPTAPWPRATC